MKRTTLLKTMLLLCALVAGSGSVWADEIVVYTLTCSKPTPNTSAYDTYKDNTVNGLVWNSPGNNTSTTKLNGSSTGTECWRIGGKGAALDRTITGKSKINSAVTKITVNHNGVSSDKVTVNSVKLTVASDADFTANVSEVTVNPTIAKTSSDGPASFNITPTAPATEWTKDYYYKFTFNITVTGSSNAGLDLLSIVFYNTVDGTAATVSFTDENKMVAVGDTYTNILSKDPSDLVVTYSSSDTDIATVNSSTGQVTGIAIGSATITASWTEQTISGTKYIAESRSYTVNVGNAIEDGVFDFTNYQDYSSGLPLTTSTSTYKGNTDGGYVFEAGNVTLTTGGTGYIAWYNSGIPNNTLRIYDNSYFTITVPAGCAITSIAFTGSSLTKAKVNDDVPTNGSSYTWNGAASSVKVERGTGNVNFKTITITYDSTIPVAVSAAEYATFCAGAPLDFSATGITVYTATAGTTSVTLNEVASGKVPANTPVVLYKAGAEGTAVNVPVAASADAIAGTNDLAVSDGTVEGNGSTIYALAKKSGVVGFYLVMDGESIPSGKAYLTIASGGAPEFLGFSFGETTDLSEKVRVNSEKFATAPVYNLNGQRVAQPTKGLYIVNGRKVVIK